MHYNKPAQSIVNQVDLLKSRGLLIPNEEEAKLYLKNISYYRLEGYWWSMQSDKEKHLFKPGSTFSNIIALYNFDRELRNLIFGIIERIEISLRTRLIYYLSHETDPWWFENPKFHKNPEHFKKNLLNIDRELKNSKETFILEHYRKYYEDKRRPPAWKTLEVISFGTLSKIYGNLVSGLYSKNQIAEEFGLPNYTYMQSWLQSITQIRNICAHHGRLWNRIFPAVPKKLKKPSNKWINEKVFPGDHRKLYPQLCCIKYLLLDIDREKHFTSGLKGLFEKYPNIDKRAMGFTLHWNEQPLWLD